MPTLENGKDYDVNDILHNSQCSGCGTTMEFEIMGDHDCNSWDCWCDCGTNTHLNGNPMVSCNIDRED